MPRIPEATAQTPSSLPKGVKKAEILDAHRPQDQQRVAEIMREGGVVAFPFNGIFGIFSDIENPHAADKIYEAKGRPRDRMLVQVALPEHLHEIGEVRAPYAQEMLGNVLKEVHALGLIMHARPGFIEGLSDRRYGIPTVLPIWTEYPPLRDTLTLFREMGGIAWSGSSLNKSGDATHWRADKAIEEFEYDVDAIAQADFSHLLDHRLMSTSVVDLTGPRPRWHREGNVPMHEAQEIFTRHGFPKLYEDRDVIVVKKRIY